ncbi:hypothetical protein LEP1GSC058_0651 [Leptospira fainei serovar Hurstbridge str. BUT 6]|uniref:Uncharacterized protein n=1 Tax=Leptospira fainei serovar Hurstbridge str. BUT 6 TaxID=1193011 RepID=S3W7Z8_9LEPT|nr:hypothetical protein LEP1GSC058_0651 [Leptospira fainei serovar Hurstbridge str. BUT 6]
MEFMGGFSCLWRIADRFVRIDSSVKFFIRTFKFYLARFLF